MSGPGTWEFDLVAATFLPFDTCRPLLVHTISIWFAGS